MTEQPEWNGDPFHASYDCPSGMTYDCPSGMKGRERRSSASRDSSCAAELILLSVPVCIVLL